MKYLKMLGLAAMAAAAMTAFVGSGTASANTVLCETTVTTGCAAANWDWKIGSQMNFSLKNGGTARLTDTSGFITVDTCTGGAIAGEIETTTTPRGSVKSEEVTWTGCTRTTHTVTGGELQIHFISGTHSGTVTATGFAVTITIGETTTCSYGFSGTQDIGNLIPSVDGLDAELQISVPVSLIASHSSASGCASSGKWTASYTQTTNTKLFVAET